MKTPDIKIALAELLGCPIGPPTMCPKCEAKAEGLIALINDEKAHSYGIGYRDAEKRARGRYRAF